MSMPNPLVLVSSTINHDNPDSPRLDYRELTRALNGELIGYHHSARLRHIEQRIKLDVVEALSAVRRSSQHNAILSLSEKIAIPAAVGMQMRRSHVPHVVIAHKLSSGLKTRLFHLWKLHRQFDCIVCLSRAQVDYAVHHLGMASERVHFVYDKVDHQFYTPSAEPDGNYILAVGQEQRDYATLLRAAAGFRLIVVASSPWSTSKIDVDSIGDVEVRSRIPYTELRALYAGARLVVVPLFDVDYAAGVNAALEAMAMGKALIISQTRGISDYVVPGETAVYTRVGDADNLRDTIQSLWDSPDERRRLGANARRAVEENMNLDHYVQRVVEIMRSVMLQAPV